MTASDNTARNQAVVSKTKAAIAVSALSTLGQTALQLSDYHNSSLALGLLVAMVVPAAYAAWHWSNVWREAHSRPSLRLEPIHVIILGLLIALGGAAWQFAKPGSTAPASPAAISPTNESLTPTAAVLPAPSNKFYSRSDKESLSDFCKELITVLIQNGAEGVRDGVYYNMAQLHNRWLNIDQSQFRAETLQFPVPALMQDLQKSKDSLSAIRDAIFEKNEIVERYGLYRDERDFLLQDGSAKLQKVQGALDNFILAIAAYTEGVKTGDPELVHAIILSARPNADKFIEAVRTFQAWQFEAKRRVEGFRQTLRE